MNFLEQYYKRLDSNKVCISAIQGNNFAKQVADDFNPIHDTDSKRFCVPGDLLFSIALSQYGLNESMKFNFLGMISADTQLNYPEQDDSQQLQITTDKDKAVLGIEYSGKKAHRAAQIEQLIKRYVAFSGHNFPHILVPLMKQHNVMINPQRPLVIYESMSLSFEHLNFTDIEIKLQETTMDVAGKRGTAKLHFSLSDGDELIGSGIKTLVLSGLREYEESSIRQMCEQYSNSKNEV